MNLKTHLCGLAVTYDMGEKWDGQTRPSYPSPLSNGREQGSLYSQQKRKIADACTWLTINATFKPIIFVATSPGYTDLGNEGKLIQKFTHNLRNGYDVKNYVWVREFTQAGFPHFHFVADAPDFDIHKLTSFWSGLFDSTASNSIRLGTAPKCSKCGTKLKAKHQPCYKPSCNGSGKVEYYLKGKKMAWYLCKYLGKGIGGLERMALDDLQKSKRQFRTFAVSQQLAKASEPELYKSKMIRTGTRLGFTTWGNVEVGVDARMWQNESKSLSDKDLQKSWNWRYTGFSSTYKGFPKSWKLKK